MPRAFLLVLALVACGAPAPGDGDAGPDVGSDAGENAGRGDAGFPGTTACAPALPTEEWLGIPGEARCEWPASITIEGACGNQQGLFLAAGEWTVTATATSVTIAGGDVQPAVMTDDDGDGQIDHWRRTQSLEWDPDGARWLWGRNGVPIVLRAAGDHTDFAALSVEGVEAEPTTRCSHGAAGFTSCMARATPAAAWLARFRTVGDDVETIRQDDQGRDVVAEFRHVLRDPGGRVTGLDCEAPDDGRTSLGPGSRPGFVVEGRARWVWP